MKKNIINCSACKAHSCPVKQLLSKQWMEEMDKHKYFQAYSPRQTIVFENSKTAGIYFVCEGAVKMHIMGVHGREQIVYLAKEGDLFGYASGEQNNISYTVTALKESKVSYVYNDFFKFLLESNPKFAVELLFRKMKILLLAQEKLTHFLQIGIKARVAYAIMETYKFFKSGTGKEETSVLSRMEIAQLAGTNHQQVSRIVAELRRDSIVKADRNKMRVLNIERLSKIALGEETQK